MQAVRSGAVLGSSRGRVAMSGVRPCPTTPRHPRADGELPPARAVVTGRELLALVVVVTAAAVIAASGFWWVLRQRASRRVPWIKPEPRTRRRRHRPGRGRRAGVLGRRPRKRGRDHGA